MSTSTTKYRPTGQRILALIGVCVIAAGFGLIVFNNTEDPYNRQYATGWGLILVGLPSLAVVMVRDTFREHYQYHKQKLLRDDQTLCWLAIITISLALLLCAQWSMHINNDVSFGLGFAALCCAALAPTGYAAYLNNRKNPNQTEEVK